MKMSSACSFIFMQIKVIFIRMVSHLDSLLNRGTRKLGNGLLQPWTAVLSARWVASYMKYSAGGLISIYPGGGVFPYMGYMGMCGPNGYGFSAVFSGHK